MVNPANKPGCYALFGNSGIKLYKDANHDADNSAYNSAYNMEKKHSTLRLFLAFLFLIFIYSYFGICSWDLIFMS